VHGVAEMNKPRLGPKQVMGAKRRAQRAARISRRRLNPNLIKLAILEYFAVGNAVEGDAARQAKIAGALFALIHRYGRTAESEALRGLGERWRPNAD